MMMAKISGAQELISNLRKLATGKTQIGSSVEAGLTKAGLKLQAYSEEEVPVDKGNLKRSSFTRLNGEGLTASVVVGYTADYAVYVHEDLDAAHGEAFNSKYAKEIADGTVHSRGPNQKAKFLSDPAIEHHEELVDIIAGEVAAKGIL